MTQAVRRPPARIPPAASRSLRSRPKAREIQSGSSRAAIRRAPTAQGCRAAAASAATAEERRSALALSRGLFAAASAHEGGERDAARLRALVSGIAKDAGALDYVSVADPLTLQELEGAADRAVISLACQVGKARLIDNVLVGMTLAELG